jgi:tRNA nucleotidyltransferase (CCA-adding enzyme)
MPAERGRVEVFLVGGAVRDGLLGLPFEERDWVVTGADRTTMLAQGFTPVDAEFPVFRHPQTGDEYALARRETKRGQGYRGFDIDAGPDVTLGEDLRRRDLTINAIAQAPDGTLVDPFGGRDDLDQGLLRHVSPAFDEDPVRVLRVARFAAKLAPHGFRVAHATHRLMTRMAARGDLREVTEERLWRELSRALAMSAPWRFFEVLHRCGALADLLPPLAAAMGEPVAHGEARENAPMRALRRVSARHPGVPDRFAAVFYSCAASPDEADALSASLRAGRDCTVALRRAVAGGAFSGAAAAGDPAAVIALLRAWRALDGRTDLGGLVDIVVANGGCEGLAGVLDVATAALRGVDAATLAGCGLTGRALGEAVDAARAAAVREALAAAGLLT